MSADLELLIQLRDQASAQLQQINSNLQANQQQWKDNTRRHTIRQSPSGLDRRKQSTW